MKTFFENLKGGLTFGLGILIMLFIGGIVYASLSNVEEGDILTSEKWNELVGSVNDITLALDGGLTSTSDAVMAFNRDSCPSGWLPADGTNGTVDLRGVFIRGLNNFGTGERNDGYQDQDKDINDMNRTLGSLQYDTMRPITGELQATPINYSVSGSGAFHSIGGNGAAIAGATFGNRPLNGVLNFDSGLLGDNFKGIDTHPKNIALIYCIKA